MKLVEVKSSNIKAVGYENNNLYIQYQSGGVYMYESVCPQNFFDLINADSIGQYVNKNIKNNYICTRIV